MNSTIPLPNTRHPLLSALQQQRAMPRLTDFPALALAATATTAELDTENDTFAAVSSCLETLSRLRLSASSAWLLMLLVKSGPQTCAALALRMKVSTANVSGLTARLEALSLIRITRGEQADRRLVVVTATEAARKVLASVMALTGLGGAANVVLKSQISARR